MRNNVLLPVLLTVVSLCPSGSGWCSQSPKKTANASSFPEYAASMEAFTITSGGSAMNAFMYTATGVGPHPVVLLLHGFPGNEQNLDLAQALRRDGFNVVVVHYRGSWGSHGAFSFSNAVQDVQAALHFLRIPEQARKFRINPNHIYLIGHSMGGLVAAIVFARDSHVQGLAYLSGWNLSRDVDTWKGVELESVLSDFANSMGPLRGTTPHALVKEAKAHRAEWDLEALAPRMANRPVLVTSADYDTDTPNEVHQQPFVAALRAAHASSLAYRTLPSDHEYSDARGELIGIVTDWLRNIAFSGAQASPEIDADDAR
jgi:pimeloyl-ACP methyl ester carboxylesterase